MVRIGYSRVRDEGDADSMRAILETAGADMVFLDLSVGRGPGSRSGLDDAIRQCGVVGTLVVPQVCRLGRTARDLGLVVMELRGSAIDLEIVVGGDKLDAAAPLPAESLVSLQARFDQELAELQAAEGAGRRRGRKPALTQAQERNLMKLFDRGRSVEELMDMFGVGRSTVYRTMERLQGDPVRAAALSADQGVKGLGSEELTR